jgi:hypothetical protein
VTPLVARTREANVRVGTGLPFGYRVRREEGLLILSRPDGCFVAAFAAEVVDPFEVEFAVWEDAD